jgi:predicted RNA-binding Zn-ribbon protein involved in translation (DUF1610 family)
MRPPVEIIAARTHGREYLLHKYWSRKPSNIVSHFLSHLTPPGGIVLDPFCGSGVSLLESVTLGFTAYGFDINPAAALISSVMLNAPSLEDFARFVSPIIEDFAKLCGSAYDLMTPNTSIRYNVHEVTVSCPKCGEDVSLSQTNRATRMYTCNQCLYPLHFNLENLKTTHVISTVCDKGTELADPVQLQDQEQKSRSSYWDTKSAYDYPFAKNKRILAFSGMTTRQLFTARNFSLLSYLADRFHELEDGVVRNAALAMLTASVAQCSRLIPYRNNMSTGGPAWSVPGFWVPPKHLETNPIVHITARYAKFLQGLSSLHRRKRTGKAYIECRDALKGIRSLQKKGVRADVIFFDPPYGDSVPFVEFSQLWNSFLRSLPDVDLDISVSDRDSKEAAWNKYSERLGTILEELPRVLKSKGKLIITFNNNDPRAWTALLHALQDNHYYCEYVTYQIPAVISSKAQFSPQGSYISDIYSLWKYSPSRESPSMSMSSQFKALQRYALSRGGKLPKALAFRTFMVTLMKNNLSYKCLDYRDSFLDTLFDLESDELIWKGPSANKIPDFYHTVVKAAELCLNKASRNWYQLYEAIAKKVIDLDIGLPDPTEVRKALEGIVLFDKDRCYLIRETERARQKSLFT